MLQDKLKFIREGYSYSEYEYHVMGDIVNEMAAMQVNNFSLLHEADGKQEGNVVARIFKWIREKIAQFIRLIKSRLSKLGQVQVTPEMEAAIKQKLAKEANFEISTYPLVVRDKQGSKKDSRSFSDELTANMANTFDKIKSSKDIDEDKLPIRKLATSYISEIDFNFLDQSEGDLGKLVKYLVGERKKYKFEPSLLVTIKERIKTFELWNKYLTSNISLINDEVTHLENRLKNDPDAPKKLGIITRIVQRYMSVNSACMRVNEIHLQEIHRLLSPFKAKPSVQRGATAK